MTTNDPQQTPQHSDASRPRILVDVDERTRQGILHRARKESVRQRRRVSISEILAPLLRDEFGDDAREVEELDNPPPKSKAGRKRKDGGQ